VHHAALAAGVGQPSGPEIDAHPVLRPHAQLLLPLFVRYQGFSALVAGLLRCVGQAADLGGMGLGIHLPELLDQSENA
jgi:hypothetical protein